MPTSLSIKGKTQGNDAVTSTINYVNPNATNAQLVSLATAMNNLTTNTVADITRIDKNSLINTVEKQPRNAYLTAEGSTEHITSISASQISTDVGDPTMLDIHYDDQQGHYEDVSLTMNGEEGMSSYWFAWSGRSRSGSGSATELSTGYLAIVKESTNDYAKVTITIGEDEQYQSATLTLTITAE